MQELFEAVRAACSPAAWSRGVGLVRASAVQTEGTTDGDEIAVRVTGGRGLVAPLVTLHLDDAEWECDCASREDPCEHVAAAVIALRRSGGRAEALPAAGSSETAGGRVGYRLRRSEGGLSIERVVVANGESHTLRSTLAALASGRVDGPRVTATAADVDVERALGPRLRGRIPRGALPRVLEGLSRCDDVQLDGRRVRVSTEPAAPRGHVERVAEGWRVRVRRHPAVEEVVDDMVAVCGDVLRPLGRAELSGRERDDLQRGRVYADDRLTELVTEVIPSLARRVELDLPAEGLPRAERVPPRTRVEVERDGDRLSLLATLVYGDPVCARVDAGRLVHVRGPVPVRDEDAERRAVDALERALGLAPGRRLVLEGEAALAFAERLRAWSGEVCGSALDAFRRAGPLRPSLELVPDSGDEAGSSMPSFDVHFTLDSAPDSSPDGASTGRDGPRPGRADAARVLRAWRDGASLVALDGGGFAPLPTDWLARFGERVADLLAARDRNKRLPACCLPDLARLCDASGEERPQGDVVGRIAALADGFESLPPLAARDLPDDLRANLRGYQREGIRWLQLLRDAGLGALLADDMGLGKTLQAMCAMRGRTLVVAPTSVIPNWLEEIERFRPGLRATLYHGPGRALDPDADVTLTSYALLRLDVEQLAAVEWDGVVLDEAQAIKNPDSQVARAAFRLRAGYRFTLTGTPVENRLDELWSQLRFLNPGLLGDRRDFDERYARPITRVAGAEAPEGRAAAERLRERIRPFVLRRLKRDVAPELPPRTEMVLHCSLDDDERAVYEAVRAATRRDVLQRLEAGGGVLEALEALLRLRQAACHGGLVPGQQIERSSKLALLLEQLDEAVSEGHKALVFSQWTSLLDRVEPLLARSGISFARLDGATRDRAAVVRQFQAEAGPPVLLVSLKAGGSGLNLTAADHVFLLDPWWNPAAEDQAADRAHRIGQDKPVFVHRLVAENTVEEHILALQAEKRRVAEAALGSADTAHAMAAGSSLTRDDLLALLS